MLRYAGKISKSKFTGFHGQKHFRQKALIEGSTLKILLILCYCYVSSEPMISSYRLELTTIQQHTSNR